VNRVILAADGEDVVGLAECHARNYRRGAPAPEFVKLLRGLHAADPYNRASLRRTCEESTGGIELYVLNGIVVGRDAASNLEIESVKNHDLSGDVAGGEGEEMLAVVEVEVTEAGEVLRGVEAVQELHIREIEYVNLIWKNHNHSLLAHFYI